MYIALLKQYFSIQLYVLCQRNRNFFFLSLTSQVTRSLKLNLNPAQLLQTQSAVHMVGFYSLAKLGQANQPTKPQVHLPKHYLQLHLASYFLVSMVSSHYL